MTYQYVWFDGSMINEKNATVSIATHAIHYGTSIFEGIRGYWNGTQLNIFRLGDHVKRFKRSGEYYSISSRYTNAELQKQYPCDVCRKNKVRPNRVISDHFILRPQRNKTAFVKQIAHVHYKYCRMCGGFFCQMQFYSVAAYKIKWSDITRFPNFVFSTYV